jgi:hypothetical protein
MMPRRKSSRVVSSWRCISVVICFIASMISPKRSAASRSMVWLSPVDCS